MITIKRTHLRRVPLLLRADHEDRGPYYLVDRAGYGVSWIKPATQIRPTGEESKSAYVGNPYTRKLTWIPIFERARLAFTLVDEDDDLDPKTAKKIADETYKKLGNSASAAKAERFAYHLLSRGPKRPGKAGI